MSPNAALPYETRHRTPTVTAGFPRKGTFREFYEESPLPSYSAPDRTCDLGRVPGLAGTARAWTRLDRPGRRHRRAQQDGDLHPGLDATALATIVAATDGLKDLSGILDPPHRARRGFEQRMQHLIDIVEALISRDEHPPRLTTRCAASSQ